MHMFSQYFEILPCNNEFYIFENQPLVLINVNYHSIKTRFYINK